MFCAVGFMICFSAPRHFSKRFWNFSFLWKLAVTVAFFPAFLCSAIAATDSQKENSYFARAWTSEDGLPENKVVGLAQTPDGYLWVATLGGLVRFDGARFQRYEPASSAGYESSTMRVLELDRKGRLWLAKEGGVLICIDGNRVQSWTTKDGLPQFEGQSSIADDGEGGLWVAYTKGTVTRLKNSRVQTFTSKDGLPASGGCWLTSDRDGQLWFAKNGHIGVFRNGKFLTLLTLPPHFTRIAPARAGGIWICSGRQLLKFDEGSQPVELGELPLIHSSVEPTAILEDHEGAVWVGTAFEGLFRCDSNGVTSVATTYPAISSLDEDREGDLWVGLRGGGLDRVERRLISLIGTAAGLPFEGIQSVCSDASGALWVVGQNGTLVRQQGGRWTNSSFNEIAPGIHATCVAADAKGTVWIGTDHGALYQWENGRFQNYPLDDSVHKGGVRSLLVTKSGDVWMAADTSGTANVLYRLRGNNVKKFNLPSGYRFIRAMAEDAAGNFWAGASDGLLVRVTGDTLVDETPKDSKFSIRCLYGAPDGSLWIGYAGFGAGRWRNGKMSRFADEQGLPNDYVSQIQADDRGNIWFAGNQGVFQVRENEFDDVAAGRAARVQPVLYGRSQGLPTLQANFDYCPNALRSPDGRLYFSMLTGLAEVQPDHIRMNPLPPAVIIERVSADNRTFASYQDGGDFDGTSSLLELKNGAGQKLELPPGLQQVQIEFTALSFVAPENVQFRYQLEGLDQGWVNAGTSRSVQYSHLPPGKYRFKVIACNNDGIWNETGASLTIIMEPHIWETLWFKSAAAVVMAGVLCGSVVLALRRRHRFQIQRLEQQQSLERERTRIARDLHDDLGVGLTEIGLLGDLAGAPASPPEISREYSHEITGRARDMVGLLDEIVWAINPANDTSQSLNDYFFKYAQTLLHRASIRCRLEVVEPFSNYGLNAEQRHQLFLAFKEALNNIIRHSGATEVQVTLTTTGGELKISVADNGHGFKMPAGEGSHDGLIGMQERLRRLNGRCEVIAAGEHGTTVVLTIPIREQTKL